MLRARLATAAVAIPLLLLLIFAAPAWLFAAFLATVGLLGAAEYASIAFPQQPAERALGVLLGAVLTIAAALGPPGPPLVAALFAIVVVGLGWVIFARKDFEQGLRDLGIHGVGLLYVVLLLPHFTWLREGSHGPAWVTFVLANAMGGDSGGYFVGRALGRHKLAPRISPGKTVEGAFGILLGGLLASAIFKLLLSSLAGWDAGWREVVVLSLVGGMLGQLGDLSESVMKRTFGVKDSGWIFPGHGGILDRIDSLLFPVGFIYYYNTLIR